MNTSAQVDGVITDHSDIGSPPARAKGPEAVDRARSCVQYERERLSMLLGSQEAKVFQRGERLVPSPSHFGLRWDG